MVIPQRRMMQKRSGSFEEMDEQVKETKLKIEYVEGDDQRYCRSRRKKQAFGVLMLIR
jgi:hypothetical protein